MIELNRRIISNGQFFDCDAVVFSERFSVETRHHAHRMFFVFHEILRINMVYFTKQRYPIDVWSTNRIFMYDLVAFGSHVSVGKSTAWTIGRGNIVFSLPKLPDRPYFPSTLVFNRYHGLYPGSKVALSLKLTFHLYLTPNVGVTGAVLPLIHVPSWNAQGKHPLIRRISSFWMG